MAILPASVASLSFYAFDRANKRIVAFSKQNGAFVAQYAASAGSPSFSALTGMFVTSGSGDTNPTLYWTEGGNLMSASLAPTAAPTPLASSGSSAPLSSPTTPTPTAVSSIHPASHEGLEGGRISIAGEVDQ